MSATPAAARPAGATFRASEVALLAGLVALVFSAQGVTTALVQGREISWQWNVVHELIYFGLWGAFAPIVARLARAFWIEPGAGPKPWLAHLGFALLIAPVQVSATYVVHALGLVGFGLLEPSRLTEWLGGQTLSIVIMSFTGMLYYWVILGIYYAAAYRRLYLVQRAETAEASLDALRAQLKPHFLFNTLNSVSVLAEENPPAARAVLLRLSDLLRTVLHHEPRRLVPLADELATLEGYLEIQRVRFEDRLRVSIEVEPGCRSALVPWLVLQPLVENAVRYAVEPRAAGGTVVIRASRVDDRLRLSVEDDGPGMAADELLGEGDGVGLANTRARLASLFGDRQALRLETPPGGGARVVIELPWREAS